MKKRILYFILILLVLSLIAINYNNFDTGNVIKQQESYYPEEKVILNRVIDGDTIEVLFDDKKESIRLLKKLSALRPYDTTLYFWPANFKSGDCSLGPNKGKEKGSWPWDPPKLTGSVLAKPHPRILPQKHVKSDSR